MPKVLLPLPDVYESVTRRVAVSTAMQLARLMNLPPETNVYLPGNVDSIPMNDATFGNCCQSNVRFPGETRVVMRFTEEDDENYAFSTSVTDGENPVLFNDPIRNVVFRPVYRYVRLNCSFEYTCANITQAQRWLDDMRQRYASGRGEQLLDFEYHYVVPKPVMLVLRTVYDTIQLSEWPITETYDEWVLNCMQNNTYPKETATLIDTDKSLTIPEHQYEVLGWFDFTTTPDTPQEDGRNIGTYSVSFNYQVNYNRPTDIWLCYPILAHQKALPRDIRPLTPYSTFKQTTRKVSQTKWVFDEFQYLKSNRNIPSVVVPNTDDWFPRPSDDNQFVIFTGLLSLTTAEPNVLLDLANLGPVRFTPTMLEYIVQESNRFLKSATSVFEFRVYRNDELLIEHPLAFVPGTTKIQSQVDLDPRYVYHVQILIKRNWLLFSYDTCQRLRHYPTVLADLLTVLGVKSNFKLIGVGSPRRGFGEGTLICQGNPTPTYPWQEPSTEYCSLIHKTGVVKQSDLDLAIKLLDRIKGRYIDKETVGMVNVLYSQILTFSK